MRGARDAEVGRAEDGTIYAISLGADFVAEHEWGIARTYRALGIDPDKVGKDPFGVASRTVKRVPEGALIFRDFRDTKPATDKYSVGWSGTFLALIPYDWMVEELDKEGFKALREFHDSPGYIRGSNERDREPLTTAWSDGDFAVFARKADEAQFLEDLHQAFLNKDVAVWLGGGGVFQNSGLCLGIISRMPEDLVQLFFDKDADRDRLAKADAATGIKDRLKAASEAAGVDGWDKPFTYYALRPRWAAKFEDMETDHDVVYWLNPRQQDKVNFGWFTVEELDQWIAGEGPVPK